MPLFGIVLIKTLFAMNPLTHPFDFRESTDYWCMIMLIIAICAFVFGYAQKFSFGVIGENVTLRIRQQLYSKILQKNIGWFDEKDNAPGVISASMASDAQVINGVSAEGLAVSLQGGFSVLAGITIGFIYDWRESLVCIGCVPMLILGGALSIKF